MEFSSEIQKEIIELFNSGLNANKISKKLNVYRKKVRKLLINSGLDQSRARIKFVPKEGEEQEILDLYNNLVSIAELAKMKQTSTFRILEILVRNNIAIKTGGELQKARNGLKEGFFDILTEESEWLIGYIVADGSIFKSHKARNFKRLAFNCSTRDPDLLPKIQTLLNCTNKISYRVNKAGFKPGSESYMLAINSNRIADKLEEYGLTSKKSFNAEIKNETLKNSKHFFRGLIDGDGFVFIRSKNETRLKTPKTIYTPLIGIVGSYQTVEQFINYCNIFFGLISDKKPSKMGNIFQTQYEGEKAYKLIKHFYQESSIYLDRKYNLAMKIIEQFKEKYEKETK